MMCAYSISEWQEYRDEDALQGPGHNISGAILGLESEDLGV